jgi:hypothetical protein
VSDTIDDILMVFRLICDGIMARNRSYVSGYFVANDLPDPTSCNVIFERILAINGE